MTKESVKFQVIPGGKSPEETLSLEVSKHVDVVGTKVVGVIKGDTDLSVDMNKLMLALTDFSGLDNLQINIPADSQVSNISQSSCVFPEINFDILDDNSQDDGTISAENKVPEGSFSQEFLTNQKQYQEILDFGENDIHQLLYKAASFLNKILMDYDLGLYTPEKKLELLIEVKKILRHFKHKKQIDTFSQSFLTHPNYKKIDNAQKELYKKMLRNIFKIYFLTKNKVSEERQKQREMERLRIEREKQIIRQREQENSLKMLQNIEALEKEFGVDDETLLKEHKKVFSEIPKNPGDEISQIRQKLEKRRKERGEKLNRK